MAARSASSTPAVVLLSLFLMIDLLMASDGSKCLYESRDVESRIVHIQDYPVDLTIQTSNVISHQLTSEVLRILLHEKLGYERIKIIHNDTPANFDEILEHFFQNNSRVPNWIINLEVPIPPRYDLAHEHQLHISEEDLENCGEISPPGRFGWFIPKKLASYEPKAEYWKFFKVPGSQLFDIQDETDLAYLQKNARINTTEGYFCDSKYCQNGTFTPEQCMGLRSNQSCALMLTSFPERTAFIMDHIKELKLYMKVIWLGDNLKDVVDYFTYKYILHNTRKAVVFLEWSPGYFTVPKEKLATVALPSCDFFKSSVAGGCKYEMTSNRKLAWKALPNNANPVYQVVKEMKFRLSDFENLLIAYSPERGLYEAACTWLKNNNDTWQPWIPEENYVNDIYIGGIFPLTGAFYNARGMVRALNMAQTAVNSDTSILGNFNLKVQVRDGECNPGVVLTTFIDYIFSTERSKFIGILGPACSEAAEPIAAISKHYSTVVVAYSAEGSTFSDRSTYPFFFRTIGENRQYIPVYLQLLKSFGWKRISSLTEDGQKYTEYISSLGSVLQTHGISYILNAKFPRDRQKASLAMYLQNLKQKRSKIIIADIYDGVAREVICEAYKLEMTNQNGYVWFLPSWLATGWYNITHFNKYFNESVTCTTEEMISALNGHFTLSYAYFAPNDTIMQENITVKQWIDNYHAIPWTNSNDGSFNIYTALDTDDYFSRYAGYVYDAIWLYAYAFDRLVKKHPGASFSIHMEYYARKFVDIIEEIDFVGVSGRINFRGGPSRFSTINIHQWMNEKVHIVGEFVPNIFKNYSDHIGGQLHLNTSSITWLTPNGVQPDDGHSSEDECVFQSLSEFLQITCTNSVILVYVVSFITLSMWLFIIVIIIKKRYDKKMKQTEDYMRSIGLDKNYAIKMSNLDKWEMSRDCVVLNRMLGMGAFGTVYGGEVLMEEEKGWVPVAVKTLKAGSTTEAKVDFLSEAESMKRFDHKNIVKLLGVCTKSEPIYTIMEFMLYGDLKTYLLARRHLVTNKIADISDEVSSKKLTSMALDVARALSYLAEIKFVHRDVACRNCLVNTQRVVKLGDFGMTRPVTDNDFYCLRRKSMLPVRWMAPESLGLGIFSPASDVWSFGVLLYEIITFGNFPFQGLSNREVLEFVKKGNTLTIPPGVKPQLNGLMKSCWNRDPKARPNASEIVNFLANNSRLLTHCLDVPVSSVDVEFDCQFDVLPELMGKRNPNTTPNQKTSDNMTVSNVTLLQTLQIDNKVSNHVTPDISSPPYSRTRKYTGSDFVEETDDESLPFV